jgi:hypothetical protein
VSERTIWKYTLDVLDEQVIRMPRGAQVLTIQAQHNRPQIWALVSPDAALEARTFACFGTGHPFEGGSSLAYLGTYQIEAGALVFHVFERKS